MRYAMINQTSNIVENVLELTDEWPGDNSWATPDGYKVIQTDAGNIGDVYTDGEFSPAS
ncbi:hypothetical protein [Cupriavidus numazuensis]|uniref:Uncharacterized protein n=1 Tax=Cupriavidus numazuensis TaxID=221992 RepID=A0ABM8TCW9_9BURK|nr:hypothetical protein [Cupriavidus numazuensis]CAG2136115.1 hypothetical protein LMG26411_01197 [Cupriavidus numazuensis]